MQFKVLLIVMHYIEKKIHIPYYALKLKTDSVSPNCIPSSLSLCRSWMELTGDVWPSSLPGPLYLRSHCSPHVACPADFCVSGLTTAFKVQICTSSSRKAFSILLNCMQAHPPNFHYSFIFSNTLPHLRAANIASQQITNW